MGRGSSGYRWLRAEWTGCRSARATPGHPRSRRGAALPPPCGSKRAGRPLLDEPLRVLIVLELARVGVRVVELEVIAEAVPIAEAAGPPFHRALQVERRVVQHYDRGLAVEPEKDAVVEAARALDLQAAATIGHFLRDGRRYCTLRVTTASSGAWLLQWNDAVRDCAQR